MKLEDNDLPGLYHAADTESINAQKYFFNSLKIYLILLIVAAGISFYFPESKVGAFWSIVLFLATLGILIWLRVKKPDDIWYNGRAVAESVKTRAWRWMMRAEPYLDSEKLEYVSKLFIGDLREILKQNMSLGAAIEIDKSVKDPISETMSQIRRLNFDERLNIYAEERINDQANFYSKKSILNKKRARFLFWVSVSLHSVAVVMLLGRLWNPGLKLPIEVIATAAGVTLTWLQSKKHNELHSSYSLAAHEIVLIKGDALAIKTEKDLSEFVLDSETAFSREHTQWAARKVD